MSRLDHGGGHCLISAAAVLLTQASSRPALAVLADVVELTKPRLSGLVVATSAVGLVVAPGPVPPVRGLLMVLCTALLVGAANALNSYLERDIDACMARTASRPLPARRLDPRIALYGGLFGGLAMVVLLAVVTNPLTASLGALAFISYVGMYTPLKQYSSWALPVGAIPGALPPAMGITTVTGRFDDLALAMFVLLFVWQLPHFLSISVYLKDEYARGGLKVFALVHGKRAAAVALALAAALLESNRLAGMLTHSSPGLVPAVR